MDIGAILIGVASALLLAVYAAQPFRRRTADLDALIERWVAEEQAEPPSTHQIVTPSDALEPEAAIKTSEREPEIIETAATNFCHQCGHPVKPTHRFCRHCGALLDEA